MQLKDTKHESTISRDHKRLGLILQWIRMQGNHGIKRGNLILKSGIPFNQWQFYHPILVDMEEIEYDKPSHTYTSSTSPQVDDADLV